jgi:Icc-related predicted phosphoesterase
VDILINHGPPFGILDVTQDGIHAGSKLLLERVKKMQPRIHVFGHIHESSGSVKIDNTLFVNAGQVNRKYEVAHKPYVAYYEY